MSKLPASSSRRLVHDGFHECVGEWFAEALGAPTRAQKLGWPPILRGESTLILAPTGSGKTLAAFLAAIERLMWAPEPAKHARCRVLYVSPLKALAVDVERNLRSPIAGIVETAKRMGIEVRVPTVGVRSGDTPAADRARIQRAPPDILITTPESLYLMLTSRARSVLESVETVILDEIHQLVPNKRGAHLFLSLERLEALRAGTGSRKAPVRPLQRIGLSATQRPLDEVARLLGGFGADGARPVTVVDAGEKKPLELVVEAPNVDMGAPGDVPDLIPSGPAAGAASDAEGAGRRSIWPHVHARIVELVRAHRSTMIFVNSRRLAERLAAALNEVAGEEIALAHHGSVAREKRSQIEDRLKRGELPAIVATSSLELGIDMGAVDLVIQVEAPASVASGLQRIGRACHAVGGVPRGVIFAKHRGDLLACAAAAERMRAAEVEETFYPRNALDVLAQQIVAMAAAEEEELPVDAVYALVRSAAPYRELPRGAFEGVLDMLSGRYPSDDFAELRPRVTWDRVRGTLRAREGAHRLAVTNGGTIPDRGLYGVFLVGEGGAAGKRVGELDEEMVFEMREGEVFLLGASSWRADTITHDRVLVTPAAGEPGKMPFWHGDRPGRSRPFGEAIGKVARRIASEKPKAADRMLRGEYDLNESAATNLVAYVSEQAEATGEVPSDRAVVVERYVDEIGDWRVCVLTPFGVRVHAPWSMAVAARLREQHAGDVDVHYTDDGMVFRVPACDEPPRTESFFPASHEVEDLVTSQLAGTSLFAARFRDCAMRALLLPRRDPRRRTPLWAQRKRAGDLLAVASRHPSFPIVLETYRECLQNEFDLTGLVDVLRKVETRRIRVTTVDSRAPSPFAANVLFSFVANFIYDADAPLAERRAQALTIDHAELRELLGEVEIRKLLDPEVIEEHEHLLQRRAYPLKHADSIHDLLLLLGDQTRDELRARATSLEAADAWLAELVKARRVFPFRIAKQERFAAAEDAGRLRDALGIVPPRGLPSAFLEPTSDALVGLVARYARTHTPFAARAVAERFGVGIASVEAVLARLVRDGRLVEGAFLPAGTTAEFCDREVLTALRQKSLARLRRHVEPVDPAAFARFLPEWQGVTRRRRGPDALLAAVAQLEGAPLVASTLDTEILPARVEGYRPWDLDMLCASGEVVWRGLEPVGPNDGRIALYLSEHDAVLSSARTPVETETATRIRALLTTRGAIFFQEIARTVGGLPSQVLESLWDMVWTGEVTNDTLEPLRSRVRGPARNDGRRARGPLRTARAALPGSEGRWSLRAPSTATATERATALARALLERYGVVTREAAHAEGIAGGFSAVYDVLKSMEEAGRVRRGYFIAGRGGTQFAIPGADERLRGMREAKESAPVVLAATDPANPFGALLDWPAREGNEGARPQRAAGALVVIHEGNLLGWLGRTEQSLLTFLPAEEPARTAAAHALASALAGLVAPGKRRALLVTSVDGAPASEGPLAPFFAEAGFGRGSRGLLKRAATTPYGTAPEPDESLDA